MLLCVLLVFVSARVKIHTGHRGTPILDPEGGGVPYAEIMFKLSQPKSTHYFLIKRSIQNLSKRA